MTPNPFKSALAARTPQFGLVLGTHDSYISEIIAGAPFDWLLIDGEHSPMDATVLARQLAVLGHAGASVAFRPLRADGPGCGQCLDIGVSTLVAPNVESAAQAGALVAHTRFPPEGTRGVGTALARAAGWGRDKEFLRRTHEQICVVAQIESAAGAKAAAAIAAVEGIDALLVGPSDLAASLGHLGDPAHPDVVGVIDQVVADTVSAGKAVGLFTGDVAVARRYLAMGCSFFVVGVDTAVIANAFDALQARYAALRS